MHILVQQRQMEQQKMDSRRHKSPPRPAQPMAPQMDYNAASENARAEERRAYQDYMVLMLSLSILVFYSDNNITFKTCLLSLELLDNVSYFGQFPYNVSYLHSQSQFLKINLTSIKFCCKTKPKFKVFKCVLLDFENQKLFDTLIYRVAFCMF